MKSDGKEVVGKGSFDFAWRREVVKQRFVFIAAVYARTRKKSDPAFNAF